MLSLYGRKKLKQMSMMKMMLTIQLQTKLPSSRPTARLGEWAASGRVGGCEHFGCEYGRVACTAAPLCGECALCSECALLAVAC